MLGIYSPKKPGDVTMGNHFMSLETRVNVVGDGNMEMMILLGSSTYGMVVERAYDGDVLNPEVEQFAKFVRGETAVTPGGHKLLIGTTFNGTCPADCLGCPYGRTITTAQYANESDRRRTLAIPVDPDQLKQAMTQALEVARERGILAPGETFAAGALLAGDPGYSPYTASLIAAVSTFPGCDACRWSSIAPDTDNNVLTAFILGARQARKLNPVHVPSFQISLHSTNHEQRVRHTGVDRLLSMVEIAQAAAEIYQITGRKLTLAFVVHQDTQIDPRVLRQIFSPDSTMVSLRPIYSPTIPALAADELIALYTTLRCDGWDVVYMPPNHNSGDDGQPLELHNMRAVESLRSSGG